MSEGQAAPAAAPAAQRPVSMDQRGVPDPVQRIQAILNAEKEAPAAPAAAAPEQVPAAPEAQPEGDVPAQPNKQVEGDEPSTEDARRMAEIPLDQLEAIELETTYKGDDGSDVTEKLPVKALREGYMRQKDYQRKTAEVARQREALGEEKRQAIESERTQALQTIQQLQALVMETVAPELQGTDLNRLATDDPFEYVKRRNRLDQITNTLTNIQAKQKELAERQKSEQDAARQKLVAKTVETLQSDIPGWNEGLYQTLMKSGEKHGFKPEEVATWVDARAIKLLHKAHLYDQLQADKKEPAVEKKVVVPPKVVRPGAVQQVNPRQQQEQGAMKRLQGSGKLEDAAAVIRSRLG